MTTSEMCFKLDIFDILKCHHFIKHDYLIWYYANTWWLICFLLSSSCQNLQQIWYCMESPLSCSYVVWKWKWSEMIHFSHFETSWEYANSLVFYESLQKQICCGGHCWTDASCVIFCEVSTLQCLSRNSLHLLYWLHKVNLILSSYTINDVGL